MNPEELSRVVVIGTSGAGKTTFARELSSILGCPHVELDALYWGANWTEVADDVFRERVQAATAGNRWVVDGDYARATDLVWPKSTAVIWLNLGFAIVFSQSVDSEPFAGSYTREELWAGKPRRPRKPFRPGLEFPCGSFGRFMAAAPGLCDSSFENRVFRAASLSGRSSCAQRREVR